MVYPVGIMGGLRSPFASSIRQPRMLPNNSSLPIRRGGEDQYGPTATLDLNKLLTDMGGLVPDDRLGDVVSAPTMSNVRYDPNTIKTDEFGRRVANSVRSDGTIDTSNFLNVEAEDKRVQDDFDKRMAEFNKQQEALGEGFTRGQLRDYNAQNRLQGMKDKFTNIEQGFFDSPEFAEYLQAGKGIGTMDVRFSPYFGQQGSGSIGGAQDAAYEKYLNRTGNFGYLQGGQNFKAAEGYQEPIMGMLQPVEGGGPNLKLGLGGFDPRGPNVPGNRPTNPNNGLIDPGFTPPEFRRPRPGYRPDGFNPNMFQRPMRRPFGFGGRPMMMGMGLGMGLGMGMFGGMNPMMYGIGGANPYGMQPYSNFGRPQFPQYPQPSYGYQQPNPYMRPQPQPSPYSSYYQQPQPNYGMTFRQPSYGGYQQPSGYGNYGQMPNPYTPQQQPSYQQGGSASNGFGSMNTNNYSGYGQQQNYPSFY